MAQIHNAAGDHTLDITAAGEAPVKFLTPPVVLLPEDQLLVPLDYYSQISHGNIAGHARATLDGYNGGLGTAYEPIWAISGSAYPWLTAAQQLTVSSDATTDVFGSGTGAWVVKVDGLDTNWEPISETLNLNGRNPVTTVNSFLRVNMLMVVAAGSAGSNNGALYVGYGTVTTGVPANILSAIPATENVASQIIYSVPLGHTLELLAFRVSISAAGRLRFKTRFYAAGYPAGLWFANNTLPLPAGIGTFNSKVPLHLPEKTDLMLEGLVTTGTGQCGVIIEAVLMETTP